MALLKKNDKRRKWRSFKKNATLLSEALLSAMIITAAWYAAWTNGFHFANKTDMSAIITTLGVTYGIIATWVLDTIWDKYKKVVISTLHQDKDEFMLYRDERLPIALHLLVIFVSLPLLGMIGMIDYQSVATGIFSVFSISFILSLFWIVIKHLEDPSRSAWIAERIPAEWLKADVDEHFHLDRRA
jgi:ABC-type antimicrobial peptide transport system permease subunit